MPHEGGWLDWPAREFSLARAARNVYVALTGYRNARNIVQWCDANPQAWELVAHIMSLKQEAAKAHGR